MKNVNAFFLSACILLLPGASSFLQWKKEDPNIPEIKALYARMPEADKATETGKNITEFMYLEGKVNVGDPMADGDLYDPEGNLHHLSEFKGKYILLDFWGRNCVPCIQSIPELEEIAEIYKGKLVVVSISRDEEKIWKEFIAEKKMTGYQWNELRSSHTGLAARYKVVGVPHYVLISPQGIVQDIWSGYGKGFLKWKLKKQLK